MNTRLLAREWCLRYLAQREHSQGELRHKLLARGTLEKEVIEETLTQLCHEGLQSDSRFVEAFVRSHMARGWGPYKIEYELRQRGIRDTNSIYSDVNQAQWDDLIDSVYTKKFGYTVPTSYPERAVRERFLVSRGFERGRIRQLFSRLSYPK